MLSKQALIGRKKILPWRFYIRNISGLAKTFINIVIVISLTQ